MTCERGSVDSASLLGKSVQEDAVVTVKGTAPMLRAGAVRTALRLGVLRSGDSVEAWDGRRSDVSFMPAGIYGYRSVATDRFGNATIRAGDWFDLRRGS